MKKPVTYRSLGAVGAAAVVGTLGAMPSAGADVGAPTGECITDVTLPPLIQAEETLAVAAAALEKTKVEANAAMALQIDAQKQLKEVSADYQSALQVVEEAAVVVETSATVKSELQSKHALLMLKQIRALNLKEAAVEQQAYLLSAQALVDSRKVEYQSAYLKALASSAATSDAVVTAEAAVVTVRSLKEVATMEAALEADQLAAKSLADATAALAKAESESDAAKLAVADAEGRYKTAAASDSYVRLLEADKELSALDAELEKLATSVDLQRYFELQKQTVLSADAVMAAEADMAAATTKVEDATLAVVTAQTTYDAALAKRTTTSKTLTTSLSRSLSETSTETGSETGSTDPVIEDEIAEALAVLEAQKKLLADAETDLAKATTTLTAAKKTAASTADDLKVATATVSTSGELERFLTTTDLASDLEKVVLELSTNPDVMLVAAAETELAATRDLLSETAKQQLLASSELEAIVAEAELATEDKDAALSLATKTGALEELERSTAILDDAVAANLGAVDELDQAAAELQSTAVELDSLTAKLQATTDAVDTLTVNLEMIQGELTLLESSLQLAEADLAAAKTLAGTTEAELEAKLQAVTLAKKSVDLATGQVATAERSLALADDAVTLATVEVRRLGGSVVSAGLLTTTAGQQGELEDQAHAASLTAATVVKQATIVVAMNQSVELSRLAASEEANTLSYKFDSQHGELTLDELSDGGCRLVFTPCLDWTGTVEVVITKTTSDGTTTEIAPILVVDSAAAQPAEQSTAVTTALTKPVGGQASDTTESDTAESDTAESLAYTGIDSTQTGALGVALVIGGAVTVLLARRREFAE